MYSSADGVPAALVEERDACGVGFIAALNNRPSHSVVKQSLAALNCMEHRGATSADNISGDGAGVLTSIPWGLLKSHVDPASALNTDGTTACAVGMTFLPKDAAMYDKFMALIKDISTKRGFEVLGIRDVPTDSSVLGELSKDFVPKIRQLFFRARAGSSATQRDFEQRLYDLRREIQGNFRKAGSQEAYVCSLSSKTIVYKGMLRSCDLAQFYTDLRDPLFESPFAIYHRRFSTNTVPKWFLAQPMRLLAHNGEINTLLGNINWVKSRALSGTPGMCSDSVCDPICSVFHSNFAFLSIHIFFSSVDNSVSPLIDVGRSDSANLDRYFHHYSIDSIMLLIANKTNIA